MHINQKGDLPYIFGGPRASDFQNVVASSKILLPYANNYTLNFCGCPLSNESEYSAFLCL